MRRVLLTILSLFLITAFAAAQGTISGTVTVEGSDEPIGGAHVAAFAVDSQHPVADVRTESDGTYALEVPYGDYQVNSGAWNYYPEWYDNVQHRSEATVVSVTEDQNAENINFSLAPAEQDGGSISGRIIREGTDEGIPMAHVTATRIEGDPFERSTMSSWNGTYRLSHLAPGPYVVTASRWGFDDGAYPETLMVDNNNFENIDIYLSPMSQDLGSISGMITDQATGDPIGGAVVIARAEHTFNTRYAFSGDDGSYTISDLRADTYHVFAHKDGYFRGDYPDPVEIDGNDVSGIDIALAEIVPTGIMGTVTDADTGDPIEGVHIIAIRANDHHFHRDAVTGEDGSYTLDAPPGEYMVQARAMGYFPVDYPESVVVPDDGYIENIDFALTAIDFGSIAGTVSDPDGNPIAGAVVKARMEDGFHSRYAYTDEDGAYLIENVVPGTYTVWSFKRGFASGSYPDPVVVGDGEDVTGIDIVLEPDLPPFDGYISGTVTDEATDEPVANALILAIGFDFGHHRWWSIRRTFTAEDGTYTLEYLPSIQFKVFAVHQDYVGEFYDNVPNYRDATPVTPDADGIDFVLTPREGGLRAVGGRIIVEGLELPGESIVYASLNGEIVDVTASDIDGLYSFDNLDADTYDISVFSIYGEGELGYPADVTTGDLYGADISLMVTSADDNTDLLPKSNNLSQNYPNPFNAQTMIAFNVKDAGQVKLTVYNVLGQEVKELAEGVYQSGSYQVIWDGFDSNGQPASSGIYYYKLSIGDYSETMRMTLLK